MAPIPPGGPVVQPKQPSASAANIAAARKAYQAWYNQQLKKLQDQRSAAVKKGRAYANDVKRIDTQIKALQTTYKAVYNDAGLVQDWWKKNGGKPAGSTTGKTPEQQAQDAADAKADAEAAAADAQAKRNAADYLIALFKTYGLESLSGEIIKLVQDGVTDAASVTLQLSESDAYKKRFAANEARKAKGMKVYSPAEYLDLEEAFRKVLIFNGLPQGFYDSNDDFTNWIAGDVSPEEINDRVSIANDAVLKKDPQYLTALEKMGLNTGDMVAAVLDLKRAFPILKKLTLSAQIGAEAERFGVSWSKERADYLQGLGVTQDDARMGYGVVADNLIRAGNIGSRFGQEYNQGDLEQDWLVEKGQGPASAKRKRLGSWEEGLFQGSAGVSRKSFASKNRGEF